MHNSAVNLSGFGQPLSLASTQRAPTVPLERSAAAPSKLTITGMILFVTCVLMFGSGFKAFRPEVGGLLVHPFLFPLAAVAPFLLINRLKAFPARLLTAFLIFYMLYVLSNLAGGLRAASEIVKFTTAGVAIIGTAMLVRSRSDFVAGVIGLGIASGSMGLFGLRTMGSATGVEALDVGNKNAFSLFVLPAILLCGYMFFEAPVNSRTMRMVIKALCVSAILACVLAIFLSGNRSGYLGCVVIGAMLLKEKKLYGMLLVGMMAAGLVYAMMSLQKTDVFQHRWNQTFHEKNESDELRGHIILACIRIGFEYPITGVGANMLPTTIGSFVGGQHAGMQNIESHNVFAHIWGSAGILCFCSLVYVAWVLWFMTPPPNKADVALASEFTRAQRLVRMMVILWIIRGCFTSAILYNPGFSMGLGLAIGYCAMLSAKPKRGANPLAMAPLPGGLAHSY
ncbi:MAG TPA: O-antigen ligase family protein [Pirellulales bacterium]|nr:O-antigen ligase family protein [Pirellulales bacterium]